MDVKNKKNRCKKFVTLSIILCVCIMLISPVSHAEVLTPRVDQYLEFRIVSVENVAGKDKQVIAQLWAYNLEFSAIEINIGYDNTKVKPSNMETNEYIETEDKNMFLAAEEFTNNIDIWFMKYMPKWVQYIFGVLTSTVNQSSYVQKRVNSEGFDYISVAADEDGVMLGEFSYRLFNGKIDLTTFGLETSGDLPTGIHIYINGVDEYTDPKIFKVTLQAKSDNANLIDLKIENEQIKDFTKETTNYEIEILEEKEILGLIPITEDELATVKVKKAIPDPEDEEKTIYQEIEKETEEIAYNIPLNELGEDTQIFIEVTAEDEETTKTYTVTIKRPCGVITGSVVTQNWEGKYIASIKVYPKNTVDWEDLYGHDELPEPMKQAETNDNPDDGSYEIKLLPGEYDILIDKSGYLDYIVTNITVEKNGEINLGQVDLVPGDTNKDGYVEVEDLSEFFMNYGAIDGDSPNYTIALDYTEDGYIEVEDLSIFFINYGKIKEIINYGG